MSNALRRPMTLDDFLAWEERQELRWEFDGAGPVAMAGGTAEHAAIQGNLTAALRIRLRGRRCQFYGSDLKLLLGGTARYPDGSVVCTPVPRGRTFVEDPVVVFEVLSASTQDVDRTEKAREYRAAPSVQRYVMLEQTRVAATMHVRDGDRWLAVLLFDGDTLSMPEIGVELPLAELYLDVNLPILDPRDDEGGPISPHGRGASVR